MPATKRPLLSLLSVVALLCSCSAQTLVHFPLSEHDATPIGADLYGNGPRAVILAHGGRFGKESWRPQAAALANAGFLVLALQFRGDRTDPDASTGAFGSNQENAADLLAAIHYLQKNGAKEIDAVGASLGGDAVGDADAASPAGTLARIVILASEGGSSPQHLTGRKLFIVAREDRSGSGLRLPAIEQHYAKAPEPKQLVLLDGTAHAQFLFSTPLGPRLLSEIVTFLTAK